MTLTLLTIFKRKVAVINQQRSHPSTSISTTLCDIKKHVITQAYTLSSLAPPRASTSSTRTYPSFLHLAAQHAHASQWRWRWNVAPPTKPMTKRTANTSNMTRGMSMETVPPSSVLGPEEALRDGAAASAATEALSASAGGGRRAGPWRRRMEASERLQEWLHVC
jgi:hypothetical protein